MAMGRAALSQRRVDRARLMRFGQALWLPLGLVAIWYFMSRGSTSLYFPPLTDSLTILREEFLSSKVTDNLIPSLEVLLLGFALAVALGVIVGYFIGSSRFACAALTPILDAFRATPVIALIPASIILFGVGDTNEIVIITWGAIWPVLLSTIDGVRAVDSTYLEASRSIRLPAFERIVLVRLPAAAPQIIPGVNTAIGIAITAMVAVEMFSGSAGLGRFLINAQRTFNIAGSYAGVIAAGIVGYGLSLLFLFVERRFILKWHYDMNRRADAA